jgi:hypothetical protein
MQKYKIAKHFDRSIRHITGDKAFTLPGTNVTKIKLTVLRNSILLPRQTHPGCVLDDIFLES